MSNIHILPDLAPADPPAEPALPPMWLGWLMIASAVCYGQLMYWLIASLIRWAFL